MENIEQINESKSIKFLIGRRKSQKLYKLLDSLISIMILAGILGYFIYMYHVGYLSFKRLIIVSVVLSTLAMISAYILKFLFREKTANAELKMMYNRMQIIVDEGKNKFSVKNIPYNQVFACYITNNTLTIVGKIEDYVENANGDKIKERKNKKTISFSVYHCNPDNIKKIIESNCNIEVIKEIPKDRW